MHRNPNFETRKWPTSFQIKLFVLFKFFMLSFFTFSFLFAAVIGLLMGLLAVKKLQGKHHRDEQILPWSSHMYIVMTGNFSPSFLLNFLCISQAPVDWALWSGYYWKNIFLLQKLSKDDANFGQKWWRQKWKAKARHGLHGSQWVKVELQNSKAEAAI